MTGCSFLRRLLFWLVKVLVLRVIVLVVVAKMLYKQFASLPYQFCNLLCKFKLFSKLQLEKPNVLVLDDPTNHLDLESISALNDSLIDYKAPIIIKTHDQEIIETVTNRVIKI